MIADADSNALALALANDTAKRVAKREFINTYLENIRESLLRDVEKMPDEWDGHEIRQLVAERAARNISNAMHDRRGKRYRDFIAHCLTYNLF